MSLKSSASKLERYARANISERSPAYGQFMYHAELLRRGHTAIHKKDLKDLPAKYQQVVKNLLTKSGRDAASSRHKTAN